MSLKQRVVIQEESGCRILINPDSADYVSKVHVVEPNLNGLLGTSPSDWVIDHGAVHLKPGTKPSVIPAGDFSDQHARIVAECLKKSKQSLIVAIVSLALAIVAIVLNIK
jgi:hypothetical protein